MVVAISSGCCFDLGLNKLEAIHWLERFKGMIDGVEVLFATPNELLEFEFDDRALSFLKGLSFVSVHMPFKEVEYSCNKKTEGLMKKGISVMKEVGSKYMVFHPTDVKNFDAIRAPVQVCIENMNWKPDHEGFQTAKEVSQSLEKYPWLGFVLDVNHATGNEIPIDDFFCMKDKIFGVHCAASWWKNGKRKEHGFIVEADQKQLQEIRKISTLSAPKIIEVDFYPQKVPLIEKEIALLKSWET